MKTKQGILRCKYPSALFALLICVLILCFSGTAAFSQSPQPPAGEVTPDQWPRTSTVGGTKYTIYQPQLEKWDGYQFAAHAAVSVLPQGAKEPVFGVINVTAVTETDRLSRVVVFYNVKIESATFPSAPDRAEGFRSDLQSILMTNTFAPSLDRMQAALAVLGAEKTSQRVPVKNEPPRFVFSRTATVLVSIDGDPVWRNVQGTKLVRVLNSRALILGDTTGRVYLHLFDGFVEAPGISGPWKAAKRLPPGATDIAARLAKANVVDLMAGPPDEKNPKKKPSLKNGVPRVVVATTPTELIVTEGQPDWVQINNTMLLYAKNTTANLFKNLNDQYTYLLVTGRWFRAPDVNGPWQYVAGKDLPPDFANIPDDSPKENVKASVPGTPQAQEAVIANEIPQTARVYRAKAQFTPAIGGAPEMRGIPGTTLSYVYNSPTPIIMAGPTEWYAARSGVWFAASSLQGPWVVATSVPAVIYSIPPSSPVYYVTYLKIYEATPQYVVVGYTPGYMGTMVSADGVLVYGTGYVYAPYIGPAVWYAPPVTYGYAANPTWTPWTGWAIGFGMGCAFGAAVSGSTSYWGYAPAPYWGPYPYSASAGYVHGAYGGAAAWGPGGWAATTGNVYQHWGPDTAVSRSSAGYNAWTGNAWSSKVGTSYNSVTGRISAGQKASVSNVYTGNYAYGERGATYNPSTGTAARGGTVTYGNEYTGQQKTVDYGKVTGPGGESVSGVKTGTTSYYSGPDGNVYKNSGEGWQKYDNGNWTSLPKTAGDPTRATGTAPAASAGSAASLQAQEQARMQGDQRSASSSWGNSSWGGGFSRQAENTGASGYSGARASEGGGGWGGGSGWDRGGGGGGWDRGGMDGGGRSWGGGGWDRGGGGGWGGGGRGRR